MATGNIHRVRKPRGVQSQLPDTLLSRGLRADLRSLNEQREFIQAMCSAALITAAQEQLHIDGRAVAFMGTDDVDGAAARLAQGDTRLSL